MKFDINKDEQESIRTYCANINTMFERCYVFDYAVCRVSPTENYSTAEQAYNNNRIFTEAPFNGDRANKMRK